MLRTLVHRLARQLSLSVMGSLPVGTWNSLGVTDDTLGMIQSLLQQQPAAATVTAQAQPQAQPQSQLWCLYMMLLRDRALALPASAPAMCSAIWSLARHHALTGKPCTAGLGVTEAVKRATSWSRSMSLADCKHGADCAAAEDEVHGMVNEPVLACLQSMVEAEAVVQDEETRLRLWAVLHEALPLLQCWVRCNGGASKAGAGPTQLRSSRWSCQTPLYTRLPVPLRSSCDSPFDAIGVP